MKLRMRRATMGVVLLSILSIFFSGTPALAVGTLPGTYHGSDTLNSGEELWAWSQGGRGSEFLLSQNQALQFFAQNDSNLVVYAGYQANWSIRRETFPTYPPSGSFVSGVFLRMEANGDLVYYAQLKSWSGACCTLMTLWHSATAGNWGSRLVMQNDGNLVVYSGQGRATWSLLSAGNSWWRNPDAR
jgi:hypothetical protein